MAIGRNESDLQRKGPCLLKGYEKCYEANRVNHMVAIKRNRAIQKGHAPRVSSLLRKYCYTPDTMLSEEASDSAVLGDPAPRPDAPAAPIVVAAPSAPAMVAVPAAPVMVTAAAVPTFPAVPAPTRQPLSRVPFERRLGCQHVPGQASAGSDSIRRILPALHASTQLNHDDGSPGRAPQKPTDAQRPRDGNTSGSGSGTWRKVRKNGKSWGKIRRVVRDLPRS